MKIKRYTAPSMRAALSLVREEQGADAVILSSRRSEEGIEVIAAVDYDEALFAAARHQKSLQQASEVRAEPVQAPAPAVHPESIRQPGSPAFQMAPAPAVHPESIRAPLSPAPETAPLRAAFAPQAEPPAAAKRLMPATPAAAAPVRKPNPAQIKAPVLPESDVVRMAPRASRAAVISQSAPAPMRAVAAMAVPAPRVSVPVKASAAARTPAASPSPAALPKAPPPDFSYTLMQRELREMRKVIETGMAGMTWSDKRVREPVRAGVLEALTQMDIAPDVANSLAGLAPQRSTLEDTRNIALALLVRSLTFVSDATPVHGGITAVVGPTGAGKTTTIAKLAARWCLRHGNRDVALISTDAYRIGAREQLMTFARILDVDMYPANSARELAQLLARLGNKKLILIDTAGMGPRDVRLNEQLAALKQGARQAKILLALPAQAEAQALDEIVRAYARANPDACIITKVDEAASLGGMLSAVIRHKLKIAYVCDGQRIPDDLHSSHARRIWLVKAAQELKEGAPGIRDEAYLARTFGRMPAHA